MSWACQPTALALSRMGCGNSPACRKRQIVVLERFSWSWRSGELLAPLGASGKGTAFLEGSSSICRRWIRQLVFGECRPRRERALGYGPCGAGSVGGVWCCRGRCCRGLPWVRAWLVYGGVAAHPRLFGTAFRLGHPSRELFNTAQQVDPLRSGGELCRARMGRLVPWVWPCWGLSGRGVSLAVAA